MQSTTRTVAQSTTKNQAPNSSDGSNRVIPIPTQYRQFTGSHDATMFIMQVRYWWNKKGGRPFYKFNAPPKSDHPMYRVGDSWEEELCFTPNELRGIKDRVCTRVSGEVDAVVLLGSTDIKHMVICWKDGSNTTRWFFNENAFKAMNAQISSPTILEPAPQPEPKPTPIPVELPQPNYEPHSSNPNRSVESTVPYNRDDHSIDEQRRDAPDPACLAPDDPPPLFDFLDSLQRVWNPERLTQQHKAQARAWAADPSVSVEMWHAALERCRNKGKIEIWPYLASLLKAWPTEGIPVDLRPAPQASAAPDPDTMAYILANADDFPVMEVC